MVRREIKATLAGQVTESGYHQSCIIIIIIKHMVTIEKRRSDEAGISDDEDEDEDGDGQNQRQGYVSCAIKRTEGDWSTGGLLPGSLVSCG